MQLDYVNIDKSPFSKLVFRDPVIPFIMLSVAFHLPRESFSKKASWAVCDERIPRCTANLQTAEQHLTLSATVHMS